MSFNWNEWQTAVPRISSTCMKYLVENLICGAADDPHAALQLMTHAIHALVSLERRHVVKCWSVVYRQVISVYRDIS